MNKGSKRENKDFKPEALLPKNTAPIANSDDAPVPSLERVLFLAEVPVGNLYSSTGIQIEKKGEKVPIGAKRR